MKRANMLDVALRAGVSKTTVSHVINRTRPVEEDTRQRVLAAINALDYQPNPLARSLTTKKTNVIGVVISDSTNYFFGEMLRGVEEVLLPQNYGLIVCNTNDELARETRCLKLLLAQRVDGILTAAGSRAWKDQSTAAIGQHTPVVYVNRSFEAMDGPFVGVNNQQGAYRGVRHLIANGYESIGLLAGYQPTSTLRERVTGYEQALLEAGLPLREDWIAYSRVSIEGGRQAMRELMDSPCPPQAVFTNNNLLTIGGLLELRALGLRCPEDVAMAGFDDHPWATVADPPLTVVRQPVQELGRASAGILLALIQHKPITDTRILLDCELVVRESSVKQHQTA